MMDVTVAQAAVVQSRLTQTVATLEQKVTLLAPVRLQKGSEDPVPLFCEATAIKLGRSVAFYEVSIENAKGVLGAALPCTRARSWVGGVAMYVHGGYCFD